MRKSKAGGKSPKGMGQPTGVSKTGKKGSWGLGKEKSIPRAK